VLTCAVACLLSAITAAVAAQAPAGAKEARADLGELFGSGQLTVVNREVTRLENPRNAIHVSERADNGIVWINNSQFSEGTIQVDIRGRDEFQRSFVGIAFHGRDDKTYEAVYLRPFNFRAKEPDRHQHAVQYIMLPDYDWPRLRKEFPEEFENPVDASVSPTDWVTLRVVVKGPTIQIYVGQVASPALEVRKLGTLTGGRIGLWTGNGSDGDFKDFRILSAK
jgi:hypothetical protein